MRKIKFRAWLIKENKMVNVVVLEIENEQIKYQYEHDGLITSGREFLRNVVLEQYTGLKDKNGKEIYEGDIVLLNKQVYCRVVYEQNTCAFMLIMLPDRFYNPPLSITNEKTQYIEVIGNIHENAELLKGE